MRKDLISLYELQLHVKSWGNSNNERVRTFLKEVFKIGFTNQVSDIFTMDEFLYGDFLILDKEFLYKEYMEFLKDNEEIDDVLYYIAENNFDGFNDLCMPLVQNIIDISKTFRTKKQTDEEEEFSIQMSDMSNLEERDYNTDEFSMSSFSEEPNYEIDKEKSFLNRDFIRLLRAQKGKKEFSNEYFIRLLREQKELDEVNYIQYQSDYIPEPLKIIDIHTDILEKMEINTNEHLKYNVYARMRIEDYVSEISTLRDKISSVFSN